MKRWLLYCTCEVQGNLDRMSDQLSRENVKRELCSIVLGKQSKGR